jgi:mannose-6-phosphate isomerase-like protein (cupin superfamily)
MTGGRPGAAFPGAVGISDLRVYDWPTADGVCGGSPHMHLVCAETYVVTGGEGSVQTLTWSGYAETPLTAGSVVTFTPGTIHRLVNGDGRLRITVVMQNSGLPEAGDAVFTFPAAVLADAAANAGAAAVGDARFHPGEGVTGVESSDTLGVAVDLGIRPGSRRDGDEDGTEGDEARPHDREPPRAGGRVRIDGP